MVRWIATFAFSACLTSAIAQNGHGANVLPEPATAAMQWVVTQENTDQIGFFDCARHKALVTCRFTYKRNLPGRQLYVVTNGYESDMRLITQSGLELPVKKVALLTGPKYTAESRIIYLDSGETAWFKAEYVVDCLDIGQFRLQLHNNPRIATSKAPPLIMNASVHNPDDYKQDMQCGPKRV